MPDEAKPDELNDEQLEKAAGGFAKPKQDWIDPDQEPWINPDQEPLTPKK